MTEDERPHFLAWAFSRGLVDADGSIRHDDHVVAWREIEAKTRGLGRYKLEEDARAMAAPARGDKRCAIVRVVNAIEDCIANPGAHKPSRAELIAALEGLT